MFLGQYREPLLLLSVLMSQYLNGAFSIYPSTYSPPGTGETKCAETNASICFYWRHLFPPVVIYAKHNEYIRRHIVQMESRHKQTVTMMMKIWTSVVASTCIKYKMETRPEPRRGLVGVLSEVRQDVERGGNLDRLLAQLTKCLGKCYVCIERLYKAPSSYWLTLVLTSVIGFLGIVPGALSLAGKDDLSAIVSIIAGGCAVLLAIIQTFPREGPVIAANQPGTV